MKLYQLLNVISRQIHLKNKNFVHYRVMKIIKMNKKVNIYFTNFSPIGSRTLQSFCFIVKCPVTSVQYRSSVIYGGRPNLSIREDYFWWVGLIDSQKQIICQLLIQNQDKSTKSDQIISSVRLKKDSMLDKQKQAIFYQKQNKIGILNYVTHSNHQPHKVFQNVFNHQVEIQQDQSNSYISNTESNNGQQIQLDYSEDFQNQRYRGDQTPSNSKSNSFVKFDSYSEVQSSSIFENLDESLIAQRHPFRNDKSFFADTSFQYKNQNELSSLQKWLRKLKNVESHKKYTTNNHIELQPVILEKYMESNESYDARLNFKEIKINNKKNQNLYIQSLSLNLIEDDDKKNEEKIFECNFSISNANQSLNLNNSVDQIKFKNLTAEIPSNKNIEIKMVLNGDTNRKSRKQISGIFIKEKFLKEFEIPLFGEDEQVLASLEYKAKKIKDVSIQCLPPIQQNPFESTNYNNAFSKIGSSPQKSPTLKNKIRQRKLNNKILRRQVQDIKTTKYSYDEQQDRQIVLHSLSNQATIKGNNKNNMNVSNFSIKENSQLSSENQFQRSNTDQFAYVLPFECNSLAKIQTNRTQDSINRYGSKNLMHSFLNSSKISAHYSSPSKMKNQHNLQLRSTNLTDLQQEQSEEQQTYLKSDKCNGFQSNLNSVRKNVSLLAKNRKINKKSIAPSIQIQRKQQNSSRSQFITEINSITVIFYENLRPQEEQSGKFLILKSDKGETFITQTLFNNHLNLGWKKKSYKFTSTSIQISLYERTGHSSQCQNNHNFNVTIKFIDLMKAIKQNFYRQQIFANGHAVGTIVLLYDILMERKQFNCREQNQSDVHFKNTIQKGKRAFSNWTEMAKQSLTRNEQKSTIKIEDHSKNRRRAKTLESNKNSIIFPSIQRNVSRRPKIYEGGRNIKIGRTERFLSYNMAEVLGEL